MAFNGGSDNVSIPGTDVSTQVWTPATGFTGAIKKVTVVNNSGVGATDVVLEYDNGSVFTLDEHSSLADGDSYVFNGPFAVGSGEAINMRSSAQAVEAIFSFLEIENT